MTVPAASQSADSYMSLPRVRLRRASMADAPRLARLTGSCQESPALTEEQMSSCIEHGGALFYEADSGPVSMITWQESPGGWDLKNYSTTTDDDDLGHTRWLMTQVEALAIRLNVPRLSVSSLNTGDLTCYRRMGYEPDATDPERLSKRVGGQWQFRSVA